MARKKDYKAEELLVQRTMSAMKCFPDTRTSDSHLVFRVLRMYEATDTMELDHNLPTVNRIVAVRRAIQKTGQYTKESRL